MSPEPIGRAAAAPHLTRGHDHVQPVAAFVAWRCTLAGRRRQRHPPAVVWFDVSAWLEEVFRGSMGATVQIGILGVLEVTGIGTAALGGPRQQSLLVLLVLNAGRALSRDRIIASMWVDPPKSAVSTVQGYVSHLRKALVGSPWVIESCGGGYRLAGPDELVDSRRFDTLTTAAAGQLRSGGQGSSVAALAALEEGLGLWRGPALEGFLDVPFAAEEARRLERRRVDASLMRGEVLIGLDCHSEAVDCLEPLAAENPYNEECSLLLIRALYGAGRQRDALAAFGRIRTVLREELGLEPAPALSSMELRILRHDKTLAGPNADRVAVWNRWSRLGGDQRGSRRSPWPVYSTSFIGRRAELEEMSALLQRHRLITVTGPGGAGKTRLVVDAAEASGGDHVLDLLAFVDLGGQVPSAVFSATAAAISDLNVAPTLDAIAVALKGRRALVVLDNCEHAVSECRDLVAEILARTDATTFVVTSRAALGIDGETVWAIPPLALPDQGDQVDAVLETDAVQLFLARCETGPGAWREVDVRLIAEIVRHAEGMPLAIELASSASRSFALRDVRDRLSGTDWLDMPIPDPSRARHRSLDAMIDWSFRLLSTAEQRLLARLGIFQGWFGLADIEAVCCDDALPARDAFALLGKLVRSSLVVLRPGEEDRPYGLLETVRAFAAGRLGSDGEERERCCRRHVEYFTDLAGEARAGLVGTVPARWLRVLDQTELDLLAAFEVCRVGGDVDRLAATALALSDHRVARYRLGDAKTILEMLRRWLPADHRSQPEAALGLATAAHLLDDFDEARLYCQQALHAAGRLGDEIGLGFALARLAEVVRSADSDATTAADLVERAERLAESHRDGLLACEALRLRSALELDAGDVTNAEATMRTWRHVARKARCSRAAAEASLQLAGLLSGRGRYVESDEMCDEAKRFYDTTGDPLESAYLLYTKARSLLYQGDVDGSALQAGEALTAFERIGDDWGVGIALRVLGEALFRAGRLDEAGGHLRRSLDLMAQRGFAEDIAASSDPLAQWALASGDLDSATQVVGAALEGMEGRPSRNRGPLLRTSAMIALRRGDVAAARRLVAEAVEECRRRGTAASLKAAEATWAEVEGATAT